ncbi:CGLD27 family protein [Microcoleus sp. LEGE 07076]|uniref:CGLD27 family protein n=1 Tax=Microcoleus sp. LEGE 07076 TaxID=915322 RepID=UPI0018825620|nr:CGLD27 family protein [Microcoleus sp. LEGE 07076]
MKNASVSICPVPQEQRPVNEYQELTESWFFSWVTLDWPEYLAKLAWVLGWSCLVSGPIAASSFAPLKYPVQFALCTAAGAGFILGLALLRLYLGWFYVRSRLANSTVVYEESGWYDCQSWSKTPEILAQDQLIVNYELEPILRRLRQTFYGLTVLLVAGGLIWNCL